MARQRWGRPEAATSSGGKGAPHPDHGTGRTTRHGTLLPSANLSTEQPVDFFMITGTAAVDAAWWLTFAMLRH